jgi:CspA family cold shock protein
MECNIRKISPDVKALIGKDCEISFDSQSLIIKDTKKYTSKSRRKLVKNKNLCIIKEFQIFIILCQFHRIRVSDTEKKILLISKKEIFKKYKTKKGTIIVVRLKGTIKFFNAQKGFGFITPDNGGKEIFVHTSNIKGNAASLHEGQKVEYVEGQGRKGPEATEVTLQ